MHALLGALLEKGDEIGALGWLLEARKDHFRARDVLLRVEQVVEQRLLAPRDAGVLVGSSVGKALHGSALAPEQTYNTNASQEKLASDSHLPQDATDTDANRTGITDSRTNRAGLALALYLHPRHLHDAQHVAKTRDTMSAMRALHLNAKTDTRQHTRMALRALGLEELGALLHVPYPQHRRTSASRNYSPICQH